ncbi:MAG: PAS domain-containing protein [Ruminococcus callidus]
MKRKYGVMIATWILWFISVLVPLFCMVLQRVPQRFLTIQFLVILLLGILLCVQWIWLRRAERIQNTAVRGEIEGAGMAALQSMTVPMILAERDGKILWSNAIFQNRFVSGRSVLGRSVQDVIHLNLAALDQNRDLLMEHNGLSYRACRLAPRTSRKSLRCSFWKSQIFCGCSTSRPTRPCVCCW